MRRPAILYTVLTLNPGGTERLAIDIALAFADEYEVSVVCLDEPGAWAEQLRSAGVPVHCVWRTRGLDLNVAGRLAALFRASGARIVHAHQCTPWFYSAIARLVHPAPRLLLEEHGRFFPEADSPLRRFVNRTVIAPLTHRVVAVSEDIRQRLIRYEGLAAERIEVVYNGAVAARPLDAATRARRRAALGLGESDFVVGTVGRLDPIKNVPLLVDAIGQASVRLGRIRGLIVGEGPARGEIEARIAAAGLASRVQLCGHRDDARDLVQCLDLFVLSSLSEGTSMALLEAMAAGVPVAVTAVGGNPEIVTAGRSGWLVPSGDTVALAQAIGSAATQADQARAFGDEGRRLFEQRFSFDAMVQAYRRIYAELTRQADSSHTVEVRL
jgi:L-malate glycosyltransferase